MVESQHAYEHCFLAKLVLLDPRVCTLSESYVANQRAITGWFLLQLDKRKRSPQGRW